VRIDTPEEMAVTIELGTETEVTEATEEIGACQGETPGVTMMIDLRGGTEIFLKAGMTVVGVVAGAVEAIVMSSQCKWEEETGRRALVLHRRRRNLHPILRIPCLLRRERGD